MTLGVPVICSARQSRSAALQIKQGLKSREAGTVQRESEAPNATKHYDQSAFLGSYGVLPIALRGQRDMDPALPSMAEMEREAMSWTGRGFSTSADF